MSISFLQGAIVGVIAFKVVSNYFNICLNNINQPLIAIKQYACGTSNIFSAIVSNNAN